MQNIIVYHNPGCGTSRNVLDFIRDAGFEPFVIEYLKTPPTLEKLKELVIKLDIPLKKLVRVNNNEEHEIVKQLETIDDATLFQAMVNDPILINRPIVIIGDNVQLCRPSETVLDMLKEI